MYIKLDYNNMASWHNFLVLGFEPKASSKPDLCFMTEHAYFTPGCLVSSNGSSSERFIKLSVLVCACNPTTWEAEAGGLL